MCVNSARVEGFIMQFQELNPQSLPPCQWFQTRTDILAAPFEILQWTPFTLTCIRMKLNMLIQKDKARENYYTVKIVHNITTSSSLIQNASFVNRALLDISARHCLES